MNDNELDHISYLNWHVCIRNCAGMSPGNFARDIHRDIYIHWSDHSCIHSSFL